LSAGGLDDGGTEVAGRLTAKAPEDWAHSGTLRAVGASAGDGASGVITRHPAHHYFGFAETQWKLLEKERPRRVKDRLRASLLALRKNPRRNPLRFYCMDPAQDAPPREEGQTASRLEPAGSRFHHGIRALR